MAHLSDKKTADRLSDQFARRFRFDPLFTRNLRGLLALITALMLALAFCLSISFESISRRKAYDQSLDQLRQTAVSTADLVETIQQVTLQIQQDQTISPILLHNSVSSGEAEVALRQLSRYQYIIHSLSSIYIYNGRTDTWYTSCGINGYANTIIPGKYFPDQTAVSLIEQYTDYQSYAAIPRKFSGQSYYTFIGYGLGHKNTEGELNCAVLVNIEASWLNDIIGSGSSGGETVVLNDKGMILSDTKNFPMQESFSSIIPDAAQIIGSDQAGFTRIKFSSDGSHPEKYLLTYTARDEMGWQYVRLTPYKTITQSIDRVRNTTILILIVFLLTGLAASWFLNQRFYRPIDQFKEDISRLETSERKNYFTLKNAYLRSLLLSPTGKESLSEKIREYGLNLIPSGNVIVAYIRPDHKEKIETLSPLDASALRYAILNIACEVSPFPSEGVDLQKGRMAIIITPPGTIPSEEEQMKFFRSVIQAIEESLSLTVSIGVSKPGTFDQLPELYEEATENWFQRLFTGDRSIFIGDNKNKITDYRYPEKKEKALADALMHGGYDKACALYLEIIGECYGGPIYVINTTVLRLASMCNQTASNFPVFKNARPFFINLSLYESIDALNETFFSFFRTICDAAETQAGSKANQLIQTVNHEISVRFSDPLLSIDALADTFDLSASYLGRVYKASTGRTILDFLLETRMQEARKLLKESSLSVSEIAAKCGFSSDSYFYKIFRQENGTTPAAFRKSQQ